MIFERRAYTMEPGHVPAFDKAQTDRGFDLVMGLPLSGSGAPTHNGHPGNTRKGG